MVYFRSMEFEHKTDKNLKCREFHNDIIDLWSLRLNVEWGKTINLAFGVTVCMYRETHI
jgi:hypothetical protein